MSGTATLLPLPRAVFYDANGNPLAGGLVNTYVPNTFTPKPTWQNSSETLQNANPITLDAAGSCLLYGSGVYQITTKDALGNAVPAYSGVTQDIYSLLGPLTVSTVPNIAALRALGTGFSPVWVEGYYAPADGGEGMFNVGLTAADNGGTIIQSANGTYYREAGGQPYSVKWFGAKGDGTANDTVAIATMDAAAATAGAAGSFPGGTYLIGIAGIPKHSGVDWIGISADAVTLKATAGTFTNGMVYGTGLSGFKISDITFDWSLASGSIGVLNFNTCDNYEISRIIITGNFAFGISHNGGDSFVFRDNLIIRTTAVNTQNQAIIVSTAAAACLYGLIDNNQMINTALDISATRTTISNNNISGWQFGAGITTEINGECSNLLIIGNTCTMGFGTDVNATVCLGIENWAPRSQIIGNTCSANSGDGINNGGQNCTIIGNDCFNNGQIAGSGIVTRYANSSVNGNYSTITGNNCFDTQGSPSQGYGYKDFNSSVFGCFISGNNFSGNGAGPMHILGTCATTTPSFQATAAFTPGSLATGTSAGGSVTVEGAVLGDVVTVSFSLDRQGVNLFAYVQTTNTVMFRMENNTGGTVTMAAGTIVVIVTKPNGYVSY